MLGPGHPVSVSVMFTSLQPEAGTGESRAWLEPGSGGQAAEADIAEPSLRLVRASASERRPAERHWSLGALSALTTTELLYTEQLLTSGGDIHW